MVVGEVSTSADVLVIGGGPGGYAAALRCAGYGKDVVLVERDAIGGTCLNVGCIPSKVLIHAAELAHLPVAAAGTGIEMQATVDLPALKRHMTNIVSGLTSGVGSLLAAAGVTVIDGTARFARASRAVVSSGESVQHIEFDQAIVATGSRPLPLAGLPFDGDRVVGSTGALLGFDEVPQHLAIVGGGYIGVELGTAWAKLGSSVTIVEAQASVLPELDSRLSRVVARRLTTLGVTVMTGALAEAMTDDGLQISTANGPKVVPADRTVVCIGRTPNTEDLGLDIVGVSTGDDGLIPVDASRRAAKRVLAIGDVTAGPALAHKATAEAEVAAKTACGIPATFDVAAIPAVVFSDPEVATVGMTKDSAAAAGITATSFVFPLGASARAKTLGQDTGHMELLTDEVGTVIGANLAGPNVSELIGEVTLAIEMAATADELAATVHPHPTMSEGLLEAAHGVLGLPLHIARSS